MKFATDENFNGRILSGLKLRLPHIDIIRVQDTEMYQSSDPKLLQWLADEDRILLTHDHHTIPTYVVERVSNGKYVAGVILVIESTSIGTAIEEIELLISVSEIEDFQNQVHYIPI